MFKSKPEAYSFALMILQSLASAESSSDGKDDIFACINFIEKAFEDHEQDVNRVVQKIQELSCSHSISNDAVCTLLKLATMFQFEEITLQERFENPLGRRAESELPINLLLHPTKAIIAAVQEISNRILDVIDTLQDDAYQFELQVFFII